MRVFGAGLAAIAIGLAAWLVPLSALGQPAGGFRAPIPLGELIGTSDVVARGRVLSAGTTSFTFEVEEVLRGPASRGRLTIEKATLDEENPRWTRYATGEELVLFLHDVARPAGSGEVGAEGTRRLQIRGFVGEGEIPLDSGWAYFPGRSLDFLAPDHYEVHGARTYLQRLDRAIVLDAIRGYARCFRWEGGGDAPGPRVLCGESELADFRARSKFHAWLAGPK